MGQLCNKIVVSVLRRLLYNDDMLLVFYLIFLNLFAFIIYGVDKYKAKNDKWRISEGFLLLTAFLGGSLGAWAGMLIWHHKTRKPKFYITVPVLSVLLIICCAFCLYSNYHLTVSEYNVELGLPEEITIVQISDLHNQSFGIGNSELMRRIEEQSPDMIVVTGDVIDSTHTSYSIALDFFEKACDIAPVYYITGNHEVRLMGTRFDEFLTRLDELGVIYLDDRYIDCGSYIIAGIADISLDDFHAYEAFNDSKPVILLGHEPQYNGLYSSLGADLALTGHYHGGQIIIPGKGGMMSPEFEFFPSIYEGIHDFGGMKLVLSRGLGNSVFPVRINDYPEIVVVKVH